MASYIALIRAGAVGPLISQATLNKPIFMIFINLILVDVSTYFRLSS